MFLLLLLIFSCHCFAQEQEEFDDICYDIGFRYGTGNIDPIEGIYSASQDFKFLIGDKVINQQQTEGDVIIYSNSNGTPRDYDNKYEFYRIGQTKTYDVNILWPAYNITQHKRIRLVYTDFFDVTFSLTVELPQQELKERFGEYYVQGLKATYTIHCKKILPNKKLIEEINKELKQ